MAEKVSFGGKPLIPSKYLEAADLNGKRVTVVIERINPRMELQSPTGKKDMRPVFFLRGKQKGWVLNKTNLNRIAEVYGSKADAWIGKPVVLYSERVESFGSMVPAVRVDVDATREVFEAGPSNRANGSGKKPSQAPDEPRHDPNTGEVIDSSSDDFADIGDPPMSEEQQTEFGDAMANDDRRAAGT